MSNLSCDVCYRINTRSYFFPISDMLFYDMCKKCDIPHHPKLLEDDKRYVCVDCIETLKTINHIGCMKIEDFNRNTLTHNQS